MFLKYLLDFEFLFFVFFLGIFSWKGASCFNGGCCFLHGGALLLSGGGGGAPWEGVEKNCRMGGKPCHGGMK